MKQLAIFFTLSFTACNWVPAALQDNPAEEEVEKYIQEKTGINVDFTGSSKE